MGLSRKSLVIFIACLFTLEVLYVVRSIRSRQERAALVEEPAAAPEPPETSSVKDVSEPKPAAPKNDPSANVYLQDAWRLVHAAQKRPADEEAKWKKALDVINRMMTEHPEWIRTAETQNKAAAASDDPFPLKDQSQISPEELHSLFQRYGALYDVGTAEFIRVMAYDRLTDFAKARKQQYNSEVLDQKKIDAAERVATRYYYAQTYEGGELWRPVRALRDYVEAKDLPANLSSEAP